MRNMRHGATLWTLGPLIVALALTMGCAKQEEEPDVGVAPGGPAAGAPVAPPTEGASYRVAISSRPGQWNLDERERGYRETFEAEYPQIEVIQTIDDETTYSAGAKKSADLISANPDVNGFAGCNAASGPGIATAVREADRVGDITIVAMDADTQILNEIEDGVITASIAQRQYYMTYIGVKWLYALNHGYGRRADDATNEDLPVVPETIDTGTVVVDKNNLDLFRTPSQGAKEELAEKHPDWQEFLSDRDPADHPTEEYIMIGISTGVEYWNANKAGLEDVCAELGVKSTFTGPASQNPEEQANQLDQIIARKPAGILIAPGNPDTLLPYINRAMAEGIPVICVDTDSPDSDRIAYFGTSNFEAGVMGAHTLAAAMMGIAPKGDDESAATTTGGG